MMHNAAVDFLRGVAASLDPVERFRMTIGQPDEYQIELLRTNPRLNEDDAFVTCLASRQVGKSTSIAALAWDDLTRGKDVALFAPSQRQSIELLRRVREFLERDPFAPKTNPLKTEIERLDGPGRIVSLPATDKSRGGTFDTLILDECAFMDDDSITAILPMRKADGRVLAISTPAGREGFFHQQWTQGHGSKVHALSVNIPRLAKKVEFDRRFMSDLRFRQEHLCEFLGAGIPVIGHDVLERAMSNEIGALCLT